MTSSERGSPQGDSLSLEARNRTDRDFFRALRAREFGRLDATGQAYLDYTGSGLYGASQLRWHLEWLGSRVLGNPHSENPASLASSLETERVRERVFAFFGADPAEYELVFTANASAAIKLVAEAFPFAGGSRYAMAVDNHNSVGGIREFLRRAGGVVTLLPLDGDMRLLEPLDRLPPAGSDPSLFAYPAQSNFSGVTHALELVAAARDRGYRVLLDAAAFAPTHRLDLSEVQPDFTCVSFYKMFGYPTGLGALIARREALRELRRPWYAGGTVDFVSIQNDLHQLRPDGGGFEDGTPDFLGIAALEPGLDLLEEVGMASLTARVADLTARLLVGLDALRHQDGAPAAVVYGPKSTEGRGGTVAFNLLDRTGAAIPYEDVETTARDAGVSVRGGCFCNPGAGEVAFGLPAERARRCLEATREGFTLARFRDCLGGGIAVGAVRASLGIASDEEDIDRALEVLGRIVAERG